MSHVYDDGFFDYISVGSRRSADAVCAILAPLFSRGATVLDVGCGQGVWTQRFGQSPGVTAAIGVDGAYVDRARLVIPEADFVAHDLTQPLDLGRRFTLGVSLEVGEHLPPESGPELVRTLTRHADIVLFSAAIPGQGGEFHVNERPLTYWRDEFAKAGYVPFDCVRPRLAGNTNVEPWYRYNAILYVAKSALNQLPPELRVNPVGEGASFTVVAPFGWRLRCAILRLLPRSVIDRLAALKHRVVRARHAKQAT